MYVACFLLQSRALSSWYVHDGHWSLMVSKSCVTTLYSGMAVCAPELALSPQLCMEAPRNMYTHISLTLLNMVLVVWALVLRGLLCNKTQSLGG